MEADFSGGVDKFATSYTKSSGSNINCKKNLKRIFRGFLQLPPLKFGMILKIRVRSIPYISVLIHFSVIFLIFDTMQPEMYNTGCPDEMYPK
jgi:hypothetical protein